MNWDAIIQEIDDRLTTWEDLSPKMQKLLLEFYDFEQRAERHGRGAWGGTFKALEKRGLAQDASYKFEAHCRTWGTAYDFRLTDTGRRMVEQYLKRPIVINKDVWGRLLLD